MPTSSTERRARGFTLLELLVVVVLIGLTTVLVMVNLVPGDRDRVRGEAERLAILIEQARDEAVGDGSGIALQAGADGYRFLRRDPARHWQAIADSPFQPHTLAAGIRLGPIEVDGRPSDIGQPVVFSASGTMPAMRFHLSSGSARLRIRVDSPAEVVIEHE